jgi:hypothetical protein
LPVNLFSLLNGERPAVFPMPHLFPTPRGSGLRDLSIETQSLDQAGAELGWWRDLPSGSRFNKPKFIDTLRPVSLKMIPAFSERKYIQVWLDRPGGPAVHDRIDCTIDRQWPRPESFGHDENYTDRNDLV